MGLKLETGSGGPIMSTLSLSVTAIMGSSNVFSKKIASDDLELLVAVPHLQTLCSALFCWRKRSGLNLKDILKILKCDITRHYITLKNNSTAQLRMSELVITKSSVKGEGSKHNLKSTTMNLWNKRDLKGPPISTYLEEKRSLDLAKLSINLNNAEVVYKSQKHLEMEAALLSRCLYLVKTKFRMFKFVRGLEKVNQGLLRYLQYDFQKDLSDFVATMPKQYETQTYFPSRNMLDHLLVKMQGVSKLLCRIGECALDVAAIINEHLAVGHLWQMLLLFFAISARIFAIMKHLLKLTCQLYNDLVSLRQHFKIPDVKWLRDDYEFPNDLNKFIDATWSKEDVILKPMDQTAVHLQENNTQLVDEIKKHNDAVLDQMPLELLQNNKDVGDAIKCSSSDIKKTKTFPNVKSKKKLLYQDNIFTNKIMAFNSIEDLKLYIKLQNKMCNINIKKSDFRHLDKMQWNLLYNAAKKLINKCSSQKELHIVKKVKECLLQSFS